MFPVKRIAKKVQKEDSFSSSFSSHKLTCSLGHDICFDFTFCYRKNKTNGVKRLFTTGLLLNTI
jgi:hypothetical protein